MKNNPKIKFSFYHVNCCKNVLLDEVNIHISSLANNSWIGAIFDERNQVKDKNNDIHLEKNETFSLPSGSGVYTISEDLAEVFHNRYPLIHKNSVIYCYIPMKTHQFHVDHDRFTLTFETAFLPYYLLQKKTKFMNLLNMCIPLGDLQLVETIFHAYNSISSTEYYQSIYYALLFNKKSIYTFLINEIDFKMVNNAFIELFSIYPLLEDHYYFLDFFKKFKNINMAEVLNSKPNQGDYPIFTALQAKSYYYISTYLSFGASLLVENNDGENALTYLISHQMSDVFYYIMDLIKKHDSMKFHYKSRLFIDSKTSSWKTLMMAAIENSQEDVILFLLKNQCDLTATDYNNQTLYFYLVKNTSLSLPIILKLFGIKHCPSSVPLFFLDACIEYKRNQKTVDQHSSKEQRILLDSPTFLHYLDQHSIEEFEKAKMEIEALDIDEKKEFAVEFEEQFYRKILTTCNISGETLLNCAYQQNNYIVISILYELYQMFAMETSNFVFYYDQSFSF